MSYLTGWQVPSLWSTVFLWSIERNDTQQSMSCVTHLLWPLPVLNQNPTLNLSLPTCGINLTNRVGRIGNSLDFKWWNEGFREALQFLVVSQGWKMI